MDQIDDSGFDSDNLTSAGTEEMSGAYVHPPSSNLKKIGNELIISDGDGPDHLANNGTEVTFSKTQRKPKLLQTKIEKQRQASLKRHAGLEQQKSSVLSRSRLVVPKKSHSTDSINEASQPLVVIDESEDEFAVSSRLWRKSSAPVSDMVKQLASDGYDLDLQPDDFDLDLIPPRPLNERRCLCCYNSTLELSCSIQ